MSSLNPVGVGIYMFLNGLGTDIHVADLLCESAEVHVWCKPEKNAFYYVTETCLGKFTLVNSTICNIFK